MIWVIVLIAFLLRIFRLDQSLWLDEAISALAAKDLSFRQLLLEFPKTDNHPPLFYLVLKAWGEVFGYKDITLRLLSVGFGILSLFVFYKIAILFDKTEKKSLAALSTLFLATSQIHIYYSQEIRMYMMGVFLITLVVLFYLKESKELTAKNLLLLSLCLLLTAFSDYTLYFFFPVLFAYLFLQKNKTVIFRRLFVAFLPVLFLWKFWHPIFLAQMKGGAWLLAVLPSWKEVAGGANFKQLVLFLIKYSFGRISFYPKQLYYVLASFFSLPFLTSFFLSFVKSGLRRYAFFWFWLTIPPLLGFFVSFKIPAFNYFRFIYVLPAFYFLAAAGILALRSTKKKVLLALTVILGNLLSVTIYYTDEGQQRENWRDAVSFIEANASKKDLVLFAYPEPFAPYRWFQKGKVDFAAVANSIKPDDKFLAKSTMSAVQGKEGVYYFEYLEELSDPRRVVQKTLEKQGFVLSKIYNFHGVGFIKYYER